LGDTDVYVDAQEYPLFTMSNLPAAPWRSGGRLQTSCGGIGDPFAWMFGGAGRDRTDDLKLAKLPLSQLSYGPDPIGAYSHEAHPPGPNTKKWWAWEDLNFRPHAYQARALTN
jgi:hypothetical protein